MFLSFSLIYLRDIIVYYNKLHIISYLHLIRCDLLSSKSNVSYWLFKQTYLDLFFIFATTDSCRGATCD